MRIVSLNANGLRAAIRKGFYTWLAKQKADIVCIQELRAHPEQLEGLEPPPPGFHCYFEPAEKKGYSGVALFSREKPDKLIHGFGSNEFDPEGRYLEARFGKLSVVSIYVPAGSSSEARQEAKFRFMEEQGAHLKKLAQIGETKPLSARFPTRHNI